jgi:hypothetical protein
MNKTKFKTHKTKITPIDETVPSLESRSKTKESVGSVLDDGTIDDMMVEMT